MDINSLLTEILTRVGSEYITSHTNRAKELFFDRLFTRIENGNFKETDFYHNSLLREGTVTVGTTGQVVIEGNDTDFAYAPLKIIDFYVHPDSAIVNSYMFVEKDIDYVKKIKNNTYLAPANGVIYYYYSNGTMYFYPKPTSTTTFQLIFKYIRNFDTTVFDGRDDVSAYLNEAFIYGLIAETAELLYAEINR